jgi:cell shape-determining protein MreC
MTRRLRRLLTPRRSLALAVAVLLVLSLAPARATGWLFGVGVLTDMAVAPLSRPLALLGAFLRPGGGPISDPEAAQLIAERDRWHFLYLQERVRNDDLRRQVGELQRGLAPDPDSPVRLLLAGVVGASADLSTGLIKVRAGRAQGVDVNTVACVRSVQLLGRVERVAERLCYVRPITDRRSPRLGAVVMAGSGGEARMLACVLAPSGDGSLAGVVEWTLDGETRPVDVAPGQEVRLRDDTWPMSAQMLLVGSVRAVEPDAAQPLRRRIVVRPEVDLSLAREVLLRVSPQPREDRP